MGSPQGETYSSLDELAHKLDCNSLILMSGDIGNNTFTFCPYDSETGMVMEGLMLEVGVDEITKSTVAVYALDLYGGDPVLLRSAKREFNA